MNRRRLAALGVQIVATVLVGCAANRAQSIDPPRDAGPTSAEPGWVAQSGAPRRLPGFEGCRPVSLALDEAAHFYLAVFCPAPQMPPQMQARTGQPAPAPAPALPGAPSMGPALREASLPPGSVTRIEAAADSGLILRTGPSAQLAAGGSGWAYVVEPSAAWQVAVLVTADTGRSWAWLESPYRQSHFIEPAVAASGTRVLFGALEFEPDLAFTTYVWRLPAPGSDVVPSTRVSGIGGPNMVQLNASGAVALHLVRDSSRVFAVLVRGTDELAIVESSDDGASFAEPRVVRVQTPDRRRAFGPGELFVPSGTGEIAVIPLTDGGAVRLASGGRLAGETLETLVTDVRGNLLVFVRSASGILRLRQLAPGAAAFSPAISLGPADAGVAATPRPDGSVLVAFSRENSLHLGHITVAP